MTDGRRTQKEALAQAIEGEKLFGRHGMTEERKADILSANGMRRDIGEFEDPGFIYDMDEAGRDRLIAHARQDAAQAVILASFLLRRQRRHGRVLWVAVALLAYIAWAVS